MVMLRLSKMFSSSNPAKSILTIFSTSLNPCCYASPACLSIICTVQGVLQQQQRQPGCVGDTKYSFQILRPPAALLSYLQISGRCCHSYKPKKHKIWTSQCKRCIIAIYNNWWKNAVVTVRVPWKHNAQPRILWGKFSAFPKLSERHIWFIQEIGTAVRPSPSHLLRTMSQFWENPELHSIHIYLK